MSNLVGGKSQFAMNSYPQLYMLYLYIHVYSYIYYTFIGINNHPKRMFSIMCSTKERNRKTKVRQWSLIIVSDFKVEKHTSMVQNVTDWRRFISYLRDAKHFKEKMNDVVVTSARSTPLTTKTTFNHNSEQKGVVLIPPIIVNQLSHRINACDIASVCWIYRPTIGLRIGLMLL